MKIRQAIGLALVLIPIVIGAQSCLLFVAGAAASAAVGGVSYVGDELHVTRDVSVDEAWNAAVAAMHEAEYVIDDADSRHDATGGLVVGRNAKNQLVHIRLVWRGDRITEIVIRVGAFSTAQNRAAANLLYDHMRNHFFGPPPPPLVGQ